MRAVKPFHVVVAVLALMLAACVPESRSSLPEDTRLAVDERLIGTWRTELLGNVHVAEVTRGAAGTLEVTLRSVSIEGAQRGLAPRESRHQLRFHELNGVAVIAERGPSLVDGRTVHRFASYRVDPDGSVTLLYTNQYPVMTFVAPLRVPGELRSDDPLFRDVIMNAPPGDVATVLRSHAPAEMFGVPFGPFARQ